MQRTIIFIIVVVIIVFAATAVYWFYFRQPDEESPAPPQKEIRGTGVSVTAVEVRRGDIARSIETTATLQALRKVTLKSRISSVVEQIKVSPGDPVQQGDMLLILDQRHLHNQLLKRKSDFMKAVSELVLELESGQEQGPLQRWRQYQMAVAEREHIPPYPRPATAKMAVMLSRLNVQANYNLLKESELQRSNAAIRAPFDGIISNMSVYPGTHVAIGEQLCHVTDLTRLQMHIEILEEDLAAIEIGSPVQVNCSPPHTVLITALMPAVDPERHTGTAIAYLDNPGLTYKDGQTIQVAVVKDQLRDRILIPRSALLNRNDRELVFRLEQGIAKWQYVKIGNGNARLLEVLKGLSPGDTVVTSGHYSLAHNVQVKLGSMETY